MSRGNLASTAKKTLLRISTRLVPVLVLPSQSRGLCEPLAYHCGESTPNEFNSLQAVGQWSAGATTFFDSFAEEIPPPRSFPLASSRPAHHFYLLASPPSLGTRQLQFSC